MGSTRRSTRSRASIWGLLLLFLVGTALPAMSRMTCLMSGHSEVSLGYADECCPDEQGDQGPTVKAVCCEILVAKSEKQPFAPQAPTWVPEQPVFTLGFIAVELLPLHGLPARASTRPPPLPLAERLAVVGSFLI